MTASYQSVPVGHARQLRRCVAYVFINRETSCRVTQGRWTAAIEMASLAVAVSPKDAPVVRVRDEIVHAASMHGMMLSWRKARLQVVSPPSPSHRRLQETFPAISSPPSPPPHRRPSPRPPLTTPSKSDQPLRPSGSK